MRVFLSLFILIITLLGCKDTKRDKVVYESKTLWIRQISKHVYQHVSFLDTESFGKVPCNGMIVYSEGEAVIFDTPTDDKTSSELIDWVSISLNCKITAIIPTHYHVDNLGGLREFHRQKIPSYAYDRTIRIAKEYGYPQPQHGFQNHLELKVGKEKVYVEFLGEGHTCDNVIGYFPVEDVMFGGCLIKETGSGKGNLAEANAGEWSETVKKIKWKYPDTKIVIPGHGKTGGTEFLDYTIQLFEPAGYAKQIDSLLNVRTSKPFNGIILISQNGVATYSKICGFSDLENKTRLKINDQFVVGSVSKQFTAVIILQEYDKGRLKLDEPIRKYLPEIGQSWADTITVRHLLTHTHGITELDKPIAFKAGTQYAYSQIGYDLLAKIAEKTSGKTFVALSKELFDECGMKYTFHPELKVHKSLVKGYTENENGGIEYDCA